MEDRRRSGLQFQFPRCSERTETLHEEQVHSMISVWGLLDPKSENLQDTRLQSIDVPSAHVYDSTNPEARDIYWEQLPGKLFAQGWDAFWLDSAEPEEYWPHMGDAILQQPPDCDRQWSGVHQRISVHCIHWESRITGEGEPEQARLSADALRFLRPAARGSDGVVGRRLWLLLGLAPSGSCRSELRAVWVIRIGQPTSGAIGRPTTILWQIQNSRNSTRDGLSTDYFVPFSAPMVTGRKTRYGRSTKSGRSW